MAGPGRAGARGYDRGTGRVGGGTRGDGSEGLMRGKVRVIVIAAAAVFPAGCARPEPAASAPPAPLPARSPARPPAEPDLVAGRYQPVWPFTSPAEVRAWQDAYRADGRRAWHLDAGRTALAFTRDRLGFRQLTLITGRGVSGRHARIGVGFRPEPGADPVPAAVVHLVRYGDGPLAPWEVVGTDDTTLTLTAPRYGAAVTSPVTVGGRVTGVDESIRVRVLGPAADRPIGEHCCLPAGGDRRPWSVRVSFRPPPGGDQVLTVVAATGGHVAEVERFAITAVRAAR